MYILKTEHSFDSAHFLANYNGKCSNIHGHRWKVEIEIQSKTLNNNGQLEGMIIDFGDFKKDVREIIDYYDHALIIQKDTMKNKTLDCLLNDNFRIIQVDFRPTAENFSKFFFKSVSDKGYNVRKATVYETPTNSATYINCEVDI